MSEEIPNEMLTEMNSEKLEEKMIPNQTNLLNNVFETNQSNSMD